MANFGLLIKTLGHIDLIFIELLSFSKDDLFLKNYVVFLKEKKNP